MLPFSSTRLLHPALQHYVRAPCPIDYMDIPLDRIPIGRPCMLAVVVHILVMAMYTRELQMVPDMCDFQVG